MKTEELNQFIACMRTLRREIEVKLQSVDYKQDKDDLMFTLNLLVADTLGDNALQHMIDFKRGKLQ